MITSSSNIEERPGISPRFPVIIAVVLLTLLSGVVHGVADGRWGDATNKQALAERFGDLPDILGEWELVQETKLQPNAEQMLRPYGSLVRSYRHRPTGTGVNFALIYGRRGPIAVHTPEVCYSSVGTKKARDRSAEAIATETQSHTLWSVEFIRNENGTKFEVWYGWSQGGEFVAAESPRFWLTQDLYKIQLSGPAPKAGFDPCESFVKELLPQLEQLVQ